MAENQDYDSLLNEAKGMYVSGHDNKYIEFQFAERNIDDRTIDEIIVDINKLRKAIREDQGRKRILWGVSFIGAALIITFVSSHAKFTGSYVMYMTFFMSGLAIGGVAIVIKGVADILGI